MQKDRLGSVPSSEASSSPPSPIGASEAPQGLGTKLRSAGAEPTYLGFGLTTASVLEDTAIGTRINTASSQTLEETRVSSQQLEAQAAEQRQSPTRSNL